MNDIAKFTKETVEQLDGLKGVKIERANLGPCPVCGKDVNENRKGYSCWSKDDPGCGFVDLEEEGRQEPSRLGGEGADGEPEGSRSSAATTRRPAAPRSRSPASRAAPGARSAPS